MAERQGNMPVKRDDLFEFRFVSGAVLSPDGMWAAYVVNQANRDENGYDSSIWVVNTRTRENRLLAWRGKARAPLWLDEETILFVSDRDQVQGEKRDRTDYYRISLGGGEALRAMTVPVKVKRLRKVGRDWLVLATATEDGDWEGEDYCIYTELPFWSDGRGTRSGKREALYIFKEDTGELERVTPRYLETVSFDSSPDGTAIAYCGPVYNSVMGQTCGLYLYDRERKDTKKLVGEDLYYIDHICFMGERYIFYTGTTYERTGKNPRYYLYDLETRTARRLPFCDCGVGCTVGSDARYGSGRAMAYCARDKVLYLVQTRWGESHLMAMDMDGNLTKVSREAGAVVGVDVKNGQIVVMAMRGQGLTELYALSPGNGGEQKLTGQNDEYTDKHILSRPESFRYDSRNGFEMEGYVIRPAGYEQGKRYPAVLEIHGGPKTVSGAIFSHEYQCLASLGYFVIYCNPRGSDGRGEAYADITEAFGKEDFLDFLEFTDQALERYPEIDRERVGVCGGSYGGFMCNWMVGNTNQYKAAVSQRSISNYLTKCLCGDAGYYANRLQVGAFGWEDFQKAWSASPLSCAARVRTPLLLLHSDEDYKSWLGEGIQMFSAVKRQGTDTRLVVFHRENHDLSRSGRPANRITRLKEIELWFEKYLGGNHEI